MKKLELIFENELGKSVTYSLDNPVDPADTEAIIAAMDEIIEQNVFSTSGGRVLKKKAARIVERTVDELEIN